MASVNSTSSETFDCSHLYHRYRSGEQRDTFWDEEERAWYLCDNQPCPNRYVEVVPPDNATAHRTFVEPEEGQVCRPISPVPSSESAVSEQIVLESPELPPLPDSRASSPTELLPPLPDSRASSPTALDFVYPPLPPSPPLPVVVQPLYLDVLYPPHTTPPPPSYTSDNFFLRFVIMSDSSGSGMGAVKMLESAEQYED